MSNLFGKYPAVVRVYDREPRLVHVEIEGMSNGSDEHPIAQIQYPIGDKAKHTEIRILEGDLVWVEFERGDPRYPIITGYRNANEGNVIEFRRWHHENIESDADKTQKHTAGESYTVEAGADILIKAGKTITLEAGSSITLKVGGATIVIDGSSIVANAGTIKLN